MTMADEETKPAETAQDGAGKALPPAARRALAEAADRRAGAEKEAVPAPKEVNGRAGPDPARYGDWESRGIASDF